MVQQEITPRSSGPLNLQLYQLLQARLGDVIIADEGAEMVYTVGPDPRRPGKQTVIVSSAGEYYRVCCPFCRETRSRLWINHRFGTLDPNNYPIYWLAHCFNEDCLTSPGKSAELAEMVFGFRNANDRPPPMTLRRGVRHDRGALVQVEIPGDIHSLAALPDDHAACEYLRGRGFDVGALSTDYGVGYCWSAAEDYYPLGGRIYIPLYMYRHLVGWQGRFIGELTADEQRRTPKYYTMPGMPKSRILYSFDVAREYPFVVVVEGVSDVWRVGPPAVALLGKSLSVMQLHLLMTAWPNQPIVLMLDPEARDSTLRIVQQLRGSSSCGPIVRVTLPDGQDPADLDQATVWSAIYQAAIGQGIDLYELMLASSVVSGDVAQTS